MANLLTPNEALTKGAQVVTIGTDTSVFVGPCRLVGAWIHHTTTAILNVYDSTATSSGYKLSVRNASSNMASLDLFGPAGATFQIGIHAQCTVGAAAFVAYVPL